MSHALVRALTDEQREQLRGIVVEVLEIDPAELTETSDFIDDHGADSLLAIEILARIERDLSVTLPQDALTAMTNLAEVYLLVAEHIGADADDA